MLDATTAEFNDNNGSNTVDEQLQHITRGCNGHTQPSKHKSLMRKAQQNHATTGN
jgi:hypothetical protein